MQLQQGSAVRFIGAMDRLDKAKFIGALTDQGEQVADHRTGLTIRTKFPGRLSQVGGLGELDARLGKGKWLTAIANEPGFVVKRIDMRRAAVHEKKNHPLGTGRKARSPDGERICGYSRRCRIQRG